MTNKRIALGRTRTRVWNRPGGRSDLQPTTALLRPLVGFRTRRSRVRIQPPLLQKHRADGEPGGVNRALARLLEA